MYIMGKGRAAGRIGSGQIFVGNRGSGRVGLTFRRVKTKTIGVRRFHVSGPNFWNYLPRQLSDSDLSLMSFKQHLKTELFRDAIGKRTLQALL